MITEIGKNGEGIFPELTQKAIIICSEIGFENIKKIFLPFEYVQNGNPEYDYNTDDESDITIEHVFENEILVKHSEQVIQIFHIRNLENIERMKSFDYSGWEIWLSTDKEIHAFSEYKNWKVFDSWNKFYIGFLMGRFQFDFPEEVHSFLYGNDFNCNWLNKFLKKIG
jgi:hypothetical protein